MPTGIGFSYFKTWHNTVFDEQAFGAWCTRFVKSWVDTPSVGFAEKEQGDAVWIAEGLFQKYKDQLK